MVLVCLCINFLLYQVWYTWILQGASVCSLLWHENRKIKFFIFIKFRLWKKWIFGKFQIMTIGPYYYSNNCLMSQFQKSTQIFSWILCKDYVTMLPKTTLRVGWPCIWKSISQTSFIKRSLTRSLFSIKLLHWSIKELSASFSWKLAWFRSKYLSDIWAWTFFR